MVSFTNYQLTWLSPVQQALSTILLLGLSGVITSNSSNEKSLKRRGRNGEIESGKEKAVNTKKSRCVPNGHKLVKTEKSVKQKKALMRMLKVLKRSSLLLTRMVRLIITKKSRSLLKNQRQITNHKTLRTRKYAIGRQTLTKLTKVSILTGKKAKKTLSIWTSATKP